MKRVTTLVLIVMVAVLMVSCVTDHKVALSQNKAVVGKGGIKRPDWVLRDVSDATTHYASGYGEGKTFETALLKAKLNADSILALWVNTSVEAIRDRYLEESTEDYANTFIDKFTATSKQKGEAVMSGISEVDFWEDGEGGVWVLHSVPVENLKVQIHSAINTVTADSSNFSSESEANLVYARLNKVLDEFFPEI